MLHNLMARGNFCNRRHLNNSLNSDKFPVIERSLVRHLVMRNGSF